jgi:hypothetical protein
VCPHRSLPLEIFQSLQTRHQVFGVFQRCTPQRGGAHRRRPHALGHQSVGSWCRGDLIKATRLFKNCELSGELGDSPNDRRTVEQLDHRSIRSRSLALVPFSQSSVLDARAHHPPTSVSDHLRLARSSHVRGRWPASPRRFGEIHPSSSHCTDNAHILRPPAAPSIVAVTSVEPADKSARARCAR